MKFIKSVDYIGDIRIKATDKECKVKIKYPKSVNPTNWDFQDTSSSIKKH